MVRKNKSNAIGNTIPFGGFVSTLSKGICHLKTSSIAFGHLKRIQLRVQCTHAVSFHPYLHRRCSRTKVETRQITSDPYILKIRAPIWWNYTVLTGSLERFFFVTVYQGAEQKILPLKYEGHQRLLLKIPSVQEAVHNDSMPRQSAENPPSEPQWQ